MASVSDLRDFVMRASSLNTSDSTEAALALRWMNDAYQRALALTGVRSYDASVTPDAGSDVILRSAYAPASSVAQGVSTVKHVFLNAGAGSATGRQLQRLSMEDLLRRRTADQTTTYDGPIFFAVRPSSGDIELFPATTSGNVFTVELELQPLVLVVSSATSGQEDAPSALPPHTHYEILANYAISQAFAYRGLSDKSAYFRSLYENGLSELRNWIADQGGIMGPPVRVKRSSFGGQRQNDQRW